MSEIYLISTAFHTNVYTIVLNLAIIYNYNVNFLHIIFYKRNIADILSAAKITQKF